LRWEKRGKLDAAYETVRVGPRGKAGSPTALKRENFLIEQSRDGSANRRHSRRGTQEDPENPESPIKEGAGRFERRQIPEGEPTSLVRY